MQDKFTGWDFAVDVVPGIVLLGMLIVPFPVSDIAPTSLEEYSLLFSVAALGLAFVLGHLIQTLSKWFYSGFVRRSMVGSNHFASKLEDGRTKSREGEWGVNGKIYELMQHSFSPDDASNLDDLRKVSDGQIFDLTLRYLRAQGVQKVDNFQMLSFMMRSLSVVFGFLSLLYAILIPIRLSTEDLVILSSPELAVVSGLSILLSILCHRQYVIFQKQMAKTMYRRFYVEKQF